jgi:hypothetical protein
MTGDGLRGRARTVFTEMTRAGVAEHVALQEVRRQGLEGVPARELTAAQEAVRAALSAPERAIYESWREVGHSHEQALQEVRVATARVMSDEEFDIHLGLTFGRLTQTEAARRLRALEESQQRPAEPLSKAAEYDRVSARVFGRPAGRA